MAVQGPITFQEVAASFAEEQWIRLEDWQKEIYKTVIKEVHDAVTSLGYTIINPNVVFSVKKRDETFVGVDNLSVEKNRDLPDILLKVKDQPPGEALCVIVEQPNDAQPSTCSPPKKSNAYPIKAEEEAYSIDDYNISGGEKQTCPPKGGDDLVKHESEEETDTEENLPSTTTSAVKQESDPVSDGRNQQVELCGTDLSDRNGGDQPRTEESTALEVEPKRRKIGSQVHGDILSLQEREARRLRVLEAVGKPFQAQPSFTFNTFKHEDVKTERTDIPDRRRDIRNTSWCKCGHCCVMSTVEESICCHEIFGLLAQLSDEGLCITKHTAFQELCLDRDRLDFLYRFLARIKRKNDVLYYLHKLRRTSYRAFVIWAHGFLDYRRHKPIPACVVKQVQEFLPYPAELNVGYMKMYDYPAALMALDHI